MIGVTFRIVVVLVALAQLIPVSADTFSSEIAVPYEQIARYHKEVYNSTLAQIAGVKDCASVGTSADTRPPSKRYSCGEVPLGAIDADAFKAVMTVAIPGMSGRSDGVDYRIDGADLTVSLSRWQKPGSISLAHLDEKAVVSVDTHSHLGSDTFLKLDPRGDRLDTRFCLGLPGLTINSTPIQIKGHMHKKMWWIIPDVNADIYVAVKLGQGSFASGKICSTLTTKIDSQGLPNIVLNEIENPTLTGLDQDGLKVDVRANVSGFWGFISNIARMFGVNVEGLIASAIKKKVVEVANDQIDVALNEIRSGSWFHKFLNVAVLKKSVETYSNAMRLKINSALHGQQLEDRILQGACIRLTETSGLPEGLKKDFFRVCAEKTRIDIEFFSNDSKSRSAGCYSYMFNPRLLWDSSTSPTQIKWWGQGCALVNRVTITTPTLVLPITQCVLSSYDSGLDPKSYCLNQVLTLSDALKSGDLANLLSSIAVDISKQPTEAEYYNMREVYKHRMGITLPDYTRMQALW